jgi:hypothetical protein
MNFDFDADPDPDPAAQFDANPYPASQADSDECGSGSYPDPQHLVPICVIMLARAVLPECGAIKGNRRQYGRRKGARSLGQLGIEEVVVQGLALHTLERSRFLMHINFVANSKKKKTEKNKKGKHISFFIAYERGHDLKNYLYTDERLWLPINGDTC